jgi:hypothetical protein
MLEQPESKPAPWDASGIHGMPRAREWDALTTVDVPELEGDRADFVVLSPGEVVVEDGHSIPTPLVDAIEQELDPPFRAEAVRRHDSLWAIAARKIEIIRLPGVAGTEIELASHDGERTLRVDGEQQFGSIPALERPDHVVRGRRIAGDAWEVEAHQL